MLVLDKDGTMIERYPEVGFNSPRMLNPRQVMAALATRRVHGQRLNLTAVFALVILFLPLGAFQSFAQSPQIANPATAPRLGPSQTVLRSWSEIGRKLIDMAEDFPEDKYDFRPNPAQRTFAEQLLHVAGSNDLFTDVAKGRKPVDDESRANYKTKAAIVTYIKNSFAEGAAVIKEKGDAGMTQAVKDSESGRILPLSALAYELIEHSGEHYGQLVVYYRSAGLVPPESRSKK